MDAWQRDFTETSSILHAFSRRAALIRSLACRMQAGTIINRGGTMKTFISLRRMAVVMVTSCAAAVSGTAAADAVTDWNKNLGDIAVAACISPAPDPFHESRLYAMAHVAVHDALNAIERRSRPYEYDAVAPAGASPDAAVAAAAYTVAHHEIPRLPFLFCACTANALQVTDDLYAGALAAIPDSQAKNAGVAVGIAAATAMLARRAGDGSDAPFADFAYPQGTQPGEWRFTALIPFAAAEPWGNVTPFVLQRPDEFMPEPP